MIVQPLCGTVVGEDRTEQHIGAAQVFLGNRRAGDIGLGLSHIGPTLLPVIGEAVDGILGRVIGQLAVVEAPVSHVRHIAGVNPDTQAFVPVGVVHGGSGQVDGHIELVLPKLAKSVTVVVDFVTGNALFVPREIHMGIISAFLAGVRSLDGRGRLRGRTVGPTLLGGTALGFPVAASCRAQHHQRRQQRRNQFLALFHFFHPFVCIVSLFWH